MQRVNRAHMTIKDPSGRAKRLISSGSAVLAEILRSWTSASGIARR